MECPLESSEETFPYGRPGLSPEILNQPVWSVVRVLGATGQQSHVHPALQDMTYLEIGPSQVKLVKNQDESAWMGPRPNDSVLTGDR